MMGIWVQGWKIKRLTSPQNRLQSRLMNNQSLRKSNDHSLCLTSDTTATSKCPDVILVDTLGGM